MNYKEEILKIYKQYGSKHFSKQIEKNIELYQFLLDNTPIDLNISQKCWTYINEISSICSISQKIKRWISFEKGYGFCGRANNCICANKTISNKISELKNNYNNFKKIEINEKRKETNFQKYGIENVGQLSTSKLKHKEFYSNIDLVSKQLEKQKSTLLDRYGVENPAYIPGVRDKKIKSSLEKYGVENISQTIESRNRSSVISKKTWIKRKETNFDYNKLNDKFKNICHVQFITPPIDYKGILGSYEYDFRCNKCLNEFKNYIYCGHLPICKKCHPTVYKFKSNEENEIFNFLLSNNILVEQRNRTLIYPYELDIISHDKKIAIEYCGIYWHSELSQNKLSNYHLDKLKKCEENGYKLITIFSDEWVYKKNIVKDKLLTIFGNSYSEKINARKCEIRIIDNILAKIFFESYHIQGYSPGIVNIGLYYNNDLISCISFAKQRKFIKNIEEENTYELLRYASSKIVRGGAGKLLKYFEKQYTPSKIISYADARWSTGNLYKILGFSLKNELNPGYWYTKDYSTRLHRFNFTKSKLVKQGNSKELTEWEIMQQLNYDRIWDCGQYRFEKIY